MNVLASKITETDLTRKTSLAKRVAGLDSLRFISALWVFLFHWGAAVGRGTLSGPWGAIFCGPAAVIVFLWVAGALCAFLHYHSPLPFSWTLNLFAILAFFWLMAELIEQHTRPLSRFLEWGGLWSYSIYLAHGFGLHVISKWEPWPYLTWVQMLIKGLVVLGICYLFYILIEKPSHWLARRVTIAVSKISMLGGPPR